MGMVDLGEGELNQNAKLRIETIYFFKNQSFKCLIIALCNEIEGPVKIGTVS